MKDQNSQELLFDPKTLTILIVDDHASIRMAIRRISQGLGFGEILDCPDGEQAVKILNRKPIDIMVLDLNMPKADGFKVLEHLQNREFGCEIPIVVVTGETKRDEIIKATNLGVWSYLLKPFQAPDFEKKIAQTLNAFYSPSQQLRTLRKAERCYFLGDFSGAMAHFIEAKAADPTNARATHGLALALDKLGRSAESKNMLLECIESNKHYHKAFHSLANIYLRENCTQKAIDSLKEELSINPKQPERQITLAQLVLNLGEYEIAIKHFRAALKESPTKLDALLGIARSLLKKGDIDKAFYYLKRIRRVHPRNRQALEIALQSGSDAKSEKVLEYFLKDQRATDPNDPDLNFGLINLLFAQGRYSETIPLAEQALKINPDEIKILRVTSLALAHENRLNEAIDFLKNHTKSEIASEIKLILAEMYLLADQVIPAMEILEKTLRQFPNNRLHIGIMAEGCRKNNEWAKSYLLYTLSNASEKEVQEIELKKLRCLKKIQARRKTKSAP